MSILIIGVVVVDVERERKRKLVWERMREVFLKDTLHPLLRLLSFFTLLSGEENLRRKQRVFG